MRGPVSLMAELRQLVLELHVRSLARSLAFYRRLGFKLVRREPGFCVVSWDGLPLLLDEAKAGARPPSLPPGNLRIVVPDVDAAWRRARRLRASVVSPIADRAYGLRDFTIRDPDGFGVRFASRRKGKKARD